MLLLVHIDEVHNHNSAHVPEPQLSSNFFSSILVHLVSVFFLVSGLSTYTAVNIYNIKCFCRFYYQVCPLLNRNHLSKRTLDLASYIEMIENRLLVIIEFHDLLLFRRNLGDVFKNLFIFFLVIYINV